MAQSPGVYTREEELNLISTPASTTTIAIVGPAVDGPEEVVAITSEAELIEVFGAPSLADPTVFGATLVLQEARKIYFRRVCGATDKQASGTKDNFTFKAVNKGATANNWEISVNVASGALLARATVQAKDDASNIIEGPFDLPIKSFVESFNSKFTKVQVSAPAGTEIVSLTAELAGGAASFDGITKDDYKAALEDLASTDDYRFSVLILPSLPSSGLEVEDIAKVRTSAIALCEERGDCFFGFDVANGLTVDQYLADLNAQGEAGGYIYDSSFFMSLFPNIVASDGYNGTTRIVPSSIALANKVAYTDRVYNFFNAPAGLKRGVISWAQGLERKLTKAERDKIYGEQTGGKINVGNAIINYKGQGFVIWGSKTGRRKVATDPYTHITSRRLLSELRPKVQDALAPLQFDNVDTYMFDVVKQLLEPILTPIKSLHGCVWYVIKCDSTNNSSSSLAAGNIKCNIIIKPTPALDVIEVGFTAAPDGVTFEEVA